MALGHRIRPFRTLAAPAVAHGRRPVRAAAVVRGVGEPQEQPGHRDSLFGRQGAGHVLRAEPLLRPVRRTLPARLRPAAPARRIRRAADHRGPDFDGGCPLPGTLGHRPDVAGTRRRQDRPDAEHLAGRRQYDHPAISQKPLSPRHQREPGQDRPHDQAGRIQTQGVDHGPETRIQLHQGGDRRHVPEYRGVRFERLRHQIGGPHLLQQGTPRTQHPGSRPAGGTGQGSHDVFPPP